MTAYLHQLEILLFTYLLTYSQVSAFVSRNHRRPATRGNRAVPHCITTRYGQRCFAVSGTISKNTQPPTRRDQSRILTQICALLKTALFCRAYETLP